MSSGTPLVSICLITYNHAPFIGQAIESVLAQRTDFPVEILIGEDDSSDGTREIVRRYAERHPERIRLLLGERKDVIRIDGRVTGRRNFLRTLGAAQGRYIAYLEGDDYWTDAGKLQNQVEFLESHPDYALCGHLVLTVNEGGFRHARQICTGVNAPEVIRPGDALFGTPLHPSSWVFRAFDLKAHPAYPLLVKAPAGDDVLMLMLLARGKGHCLRQYWSAYRLHEGGTWSTMPAHRQQLVMLQFGAIAWRLVRRRDRVRLAAGLCDQAAVVFSGLVASGLRARSWRPIAQFAAASVRQEVVGRPLLLLLYVAGAALAPVRALYILSRKLVRS